MHAYTVTWHIHTDNEISTNILNEIIFKNNLHWLRHGEYSILASVIMIKVLSQDYNVYKIAMNLIFF